MLLRTAKWKMATSRSEIIFFSVSAFLQRRSDLRGRKFFQLPKNLLSTGLITFSLPQRCFPLFTLIISYRSPFLISLAFIFRSLTLSLPIHCLVFYTFACRLDNWDSQFPPFSSFLSNSVVMPPVRLFFLSEFMVDSLEEKKIIFPVCNIRCRQFFSSFSNSFKFLIPREDYARAAYSLGS